MKLRAGFVSALVIASLWLGHGSALAGGGCLHGVPPSDGTGNSVRMAGNCFAATVLHVDPGTEVTWVNEDDYTHTVTGVGGTWGNYDELPPDAEVSYRFEENGVYVYSCIIHPGMVGAVVVGDGGDAGLAPAAVAALPEDPPTGAAAAALTTSGDDYRVTWVTAIAALIGLSAGLIIARARSRRISEILQPHV